MTLLDLMYYTLIFLAMLAAFGVFWIIAGYLIFGSVDSKLRKCPSCRRGGAGMIVETETEFLGVTIDRSGKQAVRVRSEKVMDHYECKHCQHTWLRTFERKERQPLKNT